MEPDRTCKRCSVARVGTLCKAYRQAHGPDGQRIMSGLRELAALAKDRGYDFGFRLLHPGLNEQELRALCWNVSSFLEDEDLKMCLPGLVK